MSDKALTIYFFSGTHWDREWYQTFQGFRYRLVSMVNGLIDLLESSPDFKVFHFDGQTIFLEDFIKIEPGKKSGLEALIREGRILVGPWYVMPDEMLLSGESLIRNLMLGHRIARQWEGEPWKFGYICDIFGHIAQMPQIFNGFGIKYAALGRGTNEHTVPAFFRWVSPDGSSCITHKIEDTHGYGVFCTRVLGWDHERYKDIREIYPRIKDYIEDEIQRSTVPFVVVMDAMDHEDAHPDTPIYMDIIKELFPAARVKHANLEGLGKELEAYMDSLPVREGELNETARDEGPFLHLISNTLSSRYPIKQANDYCQTLLEKWAEPLRAIFRMRGFRIQKTYMDLAYKYLLMNHPHDSICGCSIDQVHKDMMYRFDQCKMICTQMLDSFMNFERERLAVRTGSGEKVLVLWNPLPWPRREVVSIDLEFPPDYPCKYQEPFGYEEKNSFKIYNRRGEEIPYGLASINKGMTIRRYNQYSEKADIYTISMEVELPACGTAEYGIRPCSKPSRYLQRLSGSGYGAENDFIKFEINNDGTINVFDKVTSTSFQGLIAYLDDGEIGDGWYHVNPVIDTLISSRGNACTIEKVEDGPVRCVFKITHGLAIPDSMEYLEHGIKRSDRKVGMQISSMVGLSKGAGFIDVETAIQNNAKDHRLRMRLTTGIDTQYYFVNQPFAFITRKTGIDVKTQDWKEHEVLEKQTGGIVGKRDSRGTGLAFVSSFGIHECAAPDNGEGNLDITLFRSFAKTKMTNGEPGGQIQGELKFNYCIIPLRKEITDADLVRLQECRQTGVMTVTGNVGGDCCLMEDTGYFEILGTDICLSALKVPEDESENEIIARLYNPTAESKSAKVRLRTEIVKVHKTDLEENNLEGVQVEGCTFEVLLDAWKLQTYRIGYKPM